MLSSLNLKYTYRSNEDQLFNDFYLPCLENSVKFDRAAGYFTSSSFKVIARGLERFFYKDGKIRIICNPKLEEDDIKAMENGYQKKEEIIEKSLIREFNITEKMIEENTLDTISILIYLNKLDIKIAFAEENAIYHEKFGVFTDKFGKSVSFSGSANETYSGLSKNFEKIDVYYDKNDQHRINKAIEDFDNLWNNNTNSLVVVNLPNAIKYKLVNLGKKRYEEKYKEDTTGFVLRDYQKTAIDKWLENNNKGILEMATGTGKTITSLLARNELIRSKKRLFTLIVVPFNHLIDQWLKDINSLTDAKIINCSGSKKSWLNYASDMILNYNLEIEEECIFITTYKTVISSEMKKLLSKLSDKSLIIFDECHYITNYGFDNFPFEKFKYKLGLSATPDRWWDEEGTKFIKKSIGEVIYTYSLEEAINNHKLTEYMYYPRIVPFEEDEMNKYNDLTKKLMSISDEEQDKSKKETLLRKRANLINKAKNKIEIFMSDLKKINPTELSHTIVYCAPGQINEITYILSKMNVKVSKFNSEVSNKERQKLLSLFENGDIQILVAIKCLDEGVDIPMTKRAFFLSSTSNPREFVQRRGRILRLHDEKIYAEIIDYIVLPIGLPKKEFKRIAVKELPRFAEFNRSSLNSAEGRSILNNELENYELEYLLYKTPWEVYQENKERFTNEWT